MNEFMIMPIDKSKLDSNDYINYCRDHGVKYGFGAKETGETLGTFPPGYKEIDCSGFMRAFIAYLTNRQDLMPDGSWNEKDWLIAQNYQKVPFSDSGLSDGGVRICVFEESGKTGHIWLCYNGKTYESHGSMGPSNRMWNDPILEQISPYTTTFLVA